MRTPTGTRSASTGKPKSHEDAAPRPDSVFVPVPFAFPRPASTEAAIAVYGVIAMMAMQYSVHGTVRWPPVFHAAV